MLTLHIDLETCSNLDIKKVGLYRYAENCQILICAFAFDNQPVDIIDLVSGESLLDFFINPIFDPDILKSAYNASFEFNVYTKRALYYAVRFISSQKDFCGNLYLRRI